MEYLPVIVAILAWGFPFLFYQRKTTYFMVLALMITLAAALMVYSLISQGKVEWARILALFPIIASVTYGLGSFYGRVYLPW